MFQSLLDIYFSLPLLLIIFIPLLLFSIFLGGLLFARTCLKALKKKSQKVSVVTDSEAKTQKAKRVNPSKQEPEASEPDLSSKPAPPKRNQTAPVIMFIACILFLLWHFGVLKF